MILIIIIYKLISLDKKQPTLKHAETQTPTLKDAETQTEDVPATVLLDITNSSIKTSPSPRQALATTSPGNNLMQCPVCLDSLKIIKRRRTGRGMMTTLCGHIFCSRCLPASVRASGTCPTCRRVMSNKDYHKIYV